MTRSRVKNDFSVGIDDGASSTSMTITSGGLVGIGATSVDSYNQFKVQTSSAVAGEIIEATGSSGYSATTWKTDGGNWQVGLRHDKAGDLIFRNATSGVIPVKIDDEGVKFFNDTASANALDDYEEGTWTAQIWSSGTSPTATYTNQTGYYVKVGKMVHAAWYSSASNISNAGSGYARIAGLPFTIENFTYHFPVAMVTHTTGTAHGCSGAYGSANTSYATLQQTGITTTPTNWVTGNFYAMFSIVYRAA